MSHSQFHCTVRVYLHLHGLIFETSICYWQDQPGSPPRATAPADGTGRCIETRRCGRVREHALHGGRAAQARAGASSPGVAWRSRSVRGTSGADGPSRTRYKSGARGEAQGHRGPNPARAPTHPGIEADPRSGEPSAHLAGAPGWRVTVANRSEFSRKAFPPPARPGRSQSARGWRTAGGRAHRRRAAPPPLKQSRSIKVFHPPARPGRSQGAPEAGRPAAISLAQRSIRETHRPATVPGTRLRFVHPRHCPRASENTEV